MRLYIPIMKYVGGEEYVIIDHEILANDATIEQIKEYMADTCTDEAELLYIKAIYRNKKGKYLKERRRLEREARRQERYLMLLLQRKSSNRL